MLKVDANLSALLTLLITFNMKNIVFTRTTVLTTLLAFLAIVVSTAIVFPRSTGATIVEHAVTTADQTVVGDTLTDNSELFLPLQKNRTYVIDGALSIRGSQASCLIGFSFPTGATLTLSYIEGSPEGAGTGGVIKISGDEHGLNCSGFGGDLSVPSAVQFSGTIEMGSADGDLQFKAAATLSDESVTIESGSFLRADKI